jgi:hypothetical protein
MKAEIDSLRSNHTMYLDAVADAAYIAAHQVQAIDLQRKTAREVYTLSEFLFDIVVAFIPFDRLANHLIRDLLGKVVEKILKTRLAFKVLPIGEEGRKLEARLQARREFLLQQLRQPGEDPEKGAAAGRGHFQADAAGMARRQVRCPAILLRAGHPAGRGRTCGAYDGEGHVKGGGAG